MSVSCHSAITRLTHVLLMNLWIASARATRRVCIKKRSVFLADERRDPHQNIMPQFCRGKWKCSESLNKPNTLIFSTESLIHTVSAPCITISAWHRTECWYQIIIDCASFRAGVRLKNRINDELLASRGRWNKMGFGTLLEAACSRVWRENAALEKHQAFIANQYSLVLKCKI